MAKQDENLPEAKKEDLAEFVDEKLDKIMLLADALDASFDTSDSSESRAVDSGVQTGGVRESGRDVTKKMMKPKALKYVVDRLRTSLPLLAAAKLDLYFREYLMS